MISCICFTCWDDNNFSVPILKTILNFKMIIHVCYFKNAVLHKIIYQFRMLNFYLFFSSHFNSVESSSDI